MSVKGIDDFEIIKNIFFDYYYELDKTGKEVNKSSLSESDKNRLSKKLKEKKNIASEIFAKIEKWFANDEVKLTAKERSLIYRILSIVNEKIAEDRNVFTPHDDLLFELWFNELTKKMDINSEAINNFTEKAT